MKRNFTHKLKFFMLFGLLAVFGQMYAQQYKNGVLQGTIRVKITPSLSSAIKINKKSNGIIATGIKEMDRLHEAYSVTEMKRVFRYSPKFEEKHIRYGLNLWYEITLNPEVSAKDAVKVYANLSGIEHAEPIHERILIHGSPKPVYLSKESAKKSGEFFNDPYLSRQWHYNNTGQSGGTPGSDINLYKAWEISKGSKNVIVSVHDEGIDINHEDLKDAMWINTAELNGVAGVDDDGNGYKDDIFGFNFAKNLGKIDAMPHGTHVAGTVGAVNNNNIGVAGVAGGSGTGDGARIMSCQILGGTGTGNIPDSYVYAADMGAVISQNSWGYAAPDVYEQAVLDAIDYFVAEAGNYPGSPMKGGMVIFAAGNYAWDAKWYPQYHHNCIAVAALNASSQLAVYSNFGTWIDISAPGGQSEDNANIDPNSQYKNGVLSTLDNNSYGFMDGTSMACPHVSGVAALVVSKLGGQGFTMADLKNRLLSGTRFIDTIAYNVQYQDKMGVGAIDAWLALATDNKQAPNKIADLALEGIAQDFANLKWTVPADTDDGKPVAFEVYYSLNELDPSSIQNAKVIKLNSRLEPGEETSVEIPYLKPLTKYYFAVRAVDRWGNKSELSNQVNGSTNAGPDAQIDPNIVSLDFVIDVAQNPTQEISFDLLNNGEGFLKWEATTHHKQAFPSSIKDVRFPKIQTSHHSNGRNISSHQAREASRPVPFTIDKPASDQMTYLNPNSWNLWVVGETDTTYTNSSATRFMVTYPEGFNLTNLQAFLKHKEATGPVILEIYEGEFIADAKLMMRQEVPYTSDYGYTPINLQERIFFEQGKYFWIVFHAPAMNLYPLGAGLENSKEDSKNCYYSSDLGKTWNRFEDVYFDNQLVWAVYALSQFEKTDQYIILSPSQGSVTANNFASITASVDASNMINGEYSAKLAINTNDTEKPLIGLPVTLSISGHKPIIKSLRRIDAGGVLVGGEKIFELKLQNTGLGRFKFEPTGYDQNWNAIYFDISNPQFSYVSGLNSYFDAMTEQTLKFSFKPGQAGNSNATVTIQDDKGNSYSFELFGYGIDPPVMAIAPAENHFTDLSIGDVVSGQFTISNTGNYPLDYFIPAFADGSNMAEIPSNVHKFGYTKAKNPEGLNAEPAYNWTEISGTGTDITAQLDDQYAKRYTQVDIGFEFPFFGKNETSVYIWRYSILSFDTEGYPWSRSGLTYKWEGLPDRVISALGFSTTVETSGRIYYQRFVDKFIVQWENVPVSGTGTGTYQAVLHDNGNINIYIKELIPDSWATMEYLAWSAYIGIEDQVKNDGLLVHDYNNLDNSVISNGTAIEFVSPGQGLYTTLTNPAGTVQPGNSVTLDYTIKTEDLYVADYVEKLSVISNDPANNPGLHTANFKITTGGAPEVVQSTTELNFGKVFQTDSKTESFFMGNTGKAPVTLQSAGFSNGNFSIDGIFPQILKPGKSLIYKVSINSDNLGELTGVLTIETDEPATYQIALTGEIIDAPQLSANITEITETIESGSSASHTLTIANAGNHDLDFAPVGNSWMNITEKAPLKAVPVIPAFTYHFKSSREASGPVFDWNEINLAENKVAVGDIWRGESPWSAKIDLPFSFNFYGNEYDYLYVGYNGLISFTPDQELNPFGGDGIPNTEIPNHYIAALYGFIGPVTGSADHPKTGHYCKVEADKVTIEYCDFNTGFWMSGPMSIQIILYKTGNIKFQYKMHNDGDADAITPWGVIGVENADGNEGVQIANRTYVNRHNLAYELFPVKKYIVPAGESKDFTVKLDAKELFAGQYNDELNLINNAPQSQGMSIPVSLTVTGSADIVAPDSIGLGEILVIETPESWISPFKVYEKEFVIENNGTSKAEILSFDQTKMVSSKVYAYTKGTDWFGGTIWQWTDISNLPEFDWNTWQPIPIYLQPKSVMKYKVEMAPGVAGEHRDTLLINTDLGTISIGLAADAYLPPAIGIGSDTISIYAQTGSHTETKSLQIENLLGGYALHYNLEIDYERMGAKALKLENMLLKSAGNPLPLESKKIEAKLKNSKENKESYNRTLAYESAAQPELTLGYGGSASFYVATAFQAPADGFNLTDVKTWYAAGSWLNSKIKVQIYSGSGDIYNAKLIHSQTFEYNISAPNTNGEWLTIKLDKNILLYPKEYFFVSFGYESGALYPQGIAKMPEVVRGRYLYGNGNGSWYDIADAGAEFAANGWMVRAMEAKYERAAWVSVLSPAIDTIQVAGNKEIQIDFKAGYAKPGDNRANLVIASNDPNAPKKKVLLLLRLNDAPSLATDKTAYTINENEDFSFSVFGKDVEGDEFTMDLKNNPSFIKATVSSNALVVNCKPAFDNSGVYPVTIEATDKFGNKRELVVTITVKNVNRPPVVKNPVGDKGFDLAGMSHHNLLDVIADPDNDTLVYTVKSSNQGVIKVYMASNSVILKSESIGKSTITITGTDPYGLSVSHTFEIFIYPTAIEDLTKEQVKVYPIPTKGELNLIMPESVKSQTTVKFVNSLGKVVYIEKLNTKSSHVKFDVSAFPEGIYMMYLESENFRKTVYVIKN
jgi:subtilisin family serine protease